MIRVLCAYTVYIDHIPESKRVTEIPSPRALVLTFRNAANRDAGEDVHVRQFKSDSHSRIAICIM